MKLDAFNFSTVQSFLQILNMLEEQGTTDLRFARQQVHDYIRQEHLKYYKQERRIRRKQSPEEKCNKCGKFAQKLPVNTNKKNVVEGGYKQVILCHNPECMHEEWS